MATAKSKKTKQRPRVSAKKRAESSGSFEGTTVSIPEGINFFKVEKPGNIRIDIIPYTVPMKPGPAGPNPDSGPGEPDYTRMFYAHRGIGPNGSMYVCPARTAGKKCPICEHRNELDKNGGDPDLIKDLLPKKRQLWYVFDHEDAARGLQLWEVSYHLFGRQLDKEVKNADEEDGYEYFADPEDGFTLRVGMDQESFAGNTFYSASTIAFKARANPPAEALLDLADANPLDNLLVVLPYEKLKAIFLQEDENPEDGDGADAEAAGDAGTAPPAKPAGKKPAAKPSGKKPAGKKPAAKPKPKPKKPAVPTAASLGIEKGDEVTYSDAPCTVHKVAEDGLTVTLLDVDDDVYKGVPVTELVLADAAPDTDEPEQVDEQDEEEAEAPAADAGGDDEEWDDDWDD